MEYKRTFYDKYIKRAIDFCAALLGIILLSPVLLIVAILVRTRLGSPVLYKQQRPGLDEKIFTIFKFRSMTDERDEKGELLPDEIRLTKFGQTLRATSLDELPELINILKGDMAIVGPRPQLVKDMVFMTGKQRLRHAVRPGLTGLAQISGRNAISWENKIQYDVEYVKTLTFALDLQIGLKTIKSVILKEGISSEDMATAEDLGDYLLRLKEIGIDEYESKQLEARGILERSL